jgi:hypothetical protein
MLVARLKDTQQLTVDELIEAGVQAGVVLGSADQAAAADVLGTAHLAFHGRLRFGGLAGPS